MAKNKKQLIDLKGMNLSYEERNQTIKLLNFKTTTMSLGIEVYENGELLKTTSIVFAHLPKKLKAKLNPLF